MDTAAMFWAAALCGVFWVIWTASYWGSVPYDVPYTQENTDSKGEKYTYTSHRQDTSKFAPRRRLFVMAVAVDTVLWIVAFGLTNWSATGCAS